MEIDPKKRTILGGKGDDRRLYGDPSSMGNKTWSFFERLIAKYKIKGG